MVVGTDDLAAGLGGHFEDGFMRRLDILMGNDGGRLADGLGIDGDDLITDAEILDLSGGAIGPEDPFFFPEALVTITG